MSLKLLLFSFRGRINRLPYWLVTLVLIGLGGISQQANGMYGSENPMTIGPAIIIFINFVISVWIGLAIQIKRWHDRDKSGWWALINLIPIIGQLWVLIECGILRGTIGDNRFGGE